jgi:hypothetical protein
MKCYTTIRSRVSRSIVQRQLSRYFSTYPLQLMCSLKREPGKDTSLRWYGYRTRIEWELRLSSSSEVNNEPLDSTTEGRRHEFDSDIF